MAWWHSESTVDDSRSSADPAPLLIPPQTDAPLPKSLNELLALSKTSGEKLNHLLSWRCVTAFAQNHWLDDESLVDEHVKGEYFALKHAVADQLGLDDEAEAARLQWLRWAEEAQIEPAILHARSYATHAEAERFIDAHPGNALTGAKPSDEQIPELVSLTRDILRTQPARKVAYHYALPAAVAGAAAALARREDLAEQLADWTAQWAPRKSGADDRRLLEAQVAHSHGNLKTAAAICAEVADNPISEPVTSTIEARQMLAYLSLEAHDEDEATRQLLQIVEPALEAGLTVATLRAVRLLTALLNASEHSERAKSIGLRALALSEGMPISPLIMDIQLVTARSLFDTDECEKALRLAEPVAHWSELTDDEERTDTAYDIAAQAAERINQPRKSHDLLIQHAQHSLRIGDGQAASHALQKAARISAYYQRFDEAQRLLDEAFALIHGDWERAHWNVTRAYVRWSAEEIPEFYEAIEAAAAGYADSGDTEASAETLLQGVYCAKELGDKLHVNEYATRIQELMPDELWRGHPVLGVLNEYLSEGR